MLCAASLPAFAVDQPAPVVRPPDKIPGVYLVVMSGEPAIAYAGGLPGLAATAVQAGEDLDPGSPTVAAYVAHLRTTHDDALGAAGIPLDAKLYDYTFAADGFAAALTAPQAAALAAQPAVRAVVRDEMRTPATDSTPDFLGLSDPRGPWATGYTGDGVVIGFIDTGIWPEHASFADTGVAASSPDGFAGAACDFGDAVSGAVAHNGDDASFTCGGKIVAAQAFSAGFTARPERRIAPTDYLSARDADGHGTHTAAIAGGAQGVVAEIGDSDLPASVSGVAPRARIAAYKACWTDDTGAVACTLSDLVAAIDGAVADGVDVISYAVASGAATLGPDDLAFMYASAAGVLVAAPAGNGGPEVASIHSPGTAPWVTTVAAASDDRAFRGTLSLGDGTTIEGASTSAGTSELPVVDAAALGNPTCDPAGSFGEPIAGTIVLCADSDLTPAAVTKAVADQGGSAVVVPGLGDTRAVVAGGAELPLISVDGAAASRIAVYIAEAGSAAVATLGKGIPTEVTGSIVADFSARGPNALAPDIVKPDVTAPGVGVVAATTSSAGGATFAAQSGTSAAAAHVAGVFALLRQAHPTWSASAMKSALVTTTRRDVWTDGDLTPADALSAGSGIIQPGGAISRRGTPFNPGLVYEALLANDLGFLCGLGWGAVAGDVACDGPVLHAADLNLPSIGVAGVVGTTTVTRTVTSVADRTRVFEAHVDAPPGFFVEVAPDRLTLGPGESAQFELTITPTRAPSGEWRQGSLTWVSEDYRVASPIVAQAALLDAPAEVTGTGTSGSATFNVSFGYGGAYETLTHGLVAPTVTAGSVTADPTSDVRAALESGDGVATSRLVVEEGSVFARVALAGGADDLDLYVLGEDGSLAAKSTGVGSQELVDLTMPAAGTYTVVVHGSDVAGPEADYSLSEWVVGGESATGLDLVGSPAGAVENGRGVVSVAWSGAAAGEEMVGAVTHADAERTITVTAVRVDTSLPAAPGPLAVETADPGLGYSAGSAQ